MSATPEPGPQPKGGISMKVENVSHEDWALVGTALVLVIVLLFLPWFHISLSAGALSASASFSATSAPDGWLGVFAVLAALALVVDLGVEHLSPQTTVPAIGSSRTTTRFTLAVAAAAFVALKFLFHIHFGLFGIGFYVAVVLAAMLVVLTARARRAPVLTRPL